MTYPVDKSNPTLQEIRENPRTITNIVHITTHGNGNRFHTDITTTNNDSSFWGKTLALGTIILVFLTYLK